MATLARYSAPTEQAVALNPEQSIPSNTLLLSNAPPPPPKNFHGRDEYVNTAADLISTAPPTDPVRLAILGLGGIGKTTVALAILHHPHIRQKLRYFVPCDAFTNASMLVAGILHVFGIYKYPRDDPMQVLQNSVMFAAPMLLILDNFETPWDSPDSQSAVQAVLQRLDVPTVTLVITMRGNASPPGVQWTWHPSLVPLGKLSLDAAYKALVGANPQAVQVDSDEDIKNLLNAVECIPLAVVLIAQLSKTERCRRLLMRWQREKTSLLELHTKSKDRLNSLDVSISLSILSIQDEPEALQLLALISHLPDGVLNYEDSLQKLAPDFKKLDKVSAKLLNAALVEISAFGTMRVLSPIRHYVLEYHPCASNHLDKLYDYYFSLISAYANCEPGDAIYLEASTALQPERGNISSLLLDNVINPTPEVSRSALMISKFWTWSQPSPYLLEAMMSNRDKEEISNEMAQMHYWLGNIYAASNQDMRTYAEFTKAHLLFTQLQDSLGIAKCLQSLGKILYLQNKYSEAIQQIKQAHDQFVSVNHVLGATQCLQSLGDILRMKNQYPEATKQLQEAHVQFVKIGNVLGAAQCTQSIANILYMQYKYPEANKKLEETLAQFQRIGDAKGAAKSLQTLGEILWMSYRYSEATEMLEQARAQFVSISNILGAAQCLRSLGDILRMQNKYPEATEKLEQAQAQFTSIGNILGAAQCMNIMGDMLCMQWQPPKAIHVLEQAYAQFCKIGDRMAAASSLRSQGHALRLQHQYPEAIKKLEQAYAEFSKIGDTMGAAYCLRNLGETLRMQKQYPEAMKKLEEAHAKFLSIHNLLGSAQCLQHMGLIFQAQQQFPKAVNHLEQAYAQFLSISNALGAAQCVRSLGYIMKGQGQGVKARKHFEAARGLFIELNFMGDVSQCEKLLHAIEEV